MTLTSFACVVVNADDSVSWLTGSAYQRELLRPTKFTWENSPIRDALMGLSRNTKIAIFLDRRVDPDKRVDFQPKDLAPLADLLKDFAGSQNLGVASVGSVVYIGPQAISAKIPTLLKMRREELRKLSPVIAQRLGQRQPSDWEALTAPQELLDAIEADTGVRISGKELVPHDLWPETSLPELSFNVRMTLLLAGFDLTFEYTRGGIQLVPIPERMTLVKTDGGKVVRRTIVPGEKRFTLKVENQPVGKMIDFLKGNGLVKEVKYDASASNKTDELTSLDVKEVTRDELLRAILKPAGLDFRLDDTTLIIFAKE